MIGSENQMNTVKETKRYAGHTEKVSVLNELKNLARRGKLEVWGINSTLGIYKVAVYLWNSANIVGQENYDFFRHPRNNICSFLFLPKTQKCMEKISKQLTTFINHRRKGESLWLKKFIKENIGNIISEKEFEGTRRLKFRSLFLNIKKHWQEKRVSLIYWERVSEMHLRVPVEASRSRKWT